MMSLQIALDQVTRPSWWQEREPESPASRWHNGPEKQARVLLEIREHRKRINCAMLVEITGYTAQSIRYITAKLIAEGKIRRTDPRSASVWWVVV
jgi:hypothetical protein